MFATAIGAVVPLALISLLFGNQWVTDAILKSDFEYDKGVGRLVAWLQFPSWRLTTGERHLDNGFAYVVAIDFSLVLFFAVAAALVLAGARSLDPARNLFGAVIVGWWATFVAGGLAGLVDGVLMNWTLDYPDRTMAMMVWNGVSQGVGFGLVYGWLAGLGALVGFLVARGRTPMGAVPPGQQQPPYQARMPQALSPQHPAAVPYVPPGQQGQPGQPYQQGQPQPGWGAAPVPQMPAQPQGQPQPVAYPPPQPAPAAPAPPPPAPAPESPAAPAEDERSEQDAEPAPQDAEKPAPQDAEKPGDEPAEPAGAAAERPAEDGPEPSPEPEDSADSGGRVDAANVTMVDRGKDEGGHKPLAPPS
ncbi:hypothetical protein ACFQHO_08645 [Actinomadura yumaensis]